MLCVAAAAAAKSLTRLTWQDDAEKIAEALALGVAVALGSELSVVCQDKVPGGARPVCRGLPRLAMTAAAHCADCFLQRLRAAQWPTVYSLSTGLRAIRFACSGACVCAVEGTGAVVKKGDRVAVKYTGWLVGAAGVGTKGALFDTNDKPDGKLLKIKACFNV